MVFCSAAAAALALSGCATTLESARVDPAIANGVLQSAAAQVRRCYRSPKISHAGRQIITQLAVRLNADGTLAGLPQVISQSGLTDQNGAEAARMAEAASLAVIRCAPFRLPPEHHGLIWQSFELIFSPSRRA